MIFHWVAFSICLRLWNDFQCDWQTICHSDACAVLCFYDTYSMENDSKKCIQIRRGCRRQQGKNRRNFINFGENWRTSRCEWQQLRCCCLYENSLANRMWLRFIGRVFHHRFDGYGAYLFWWGDKSMMMNSILSFHCFPMKRVVTWCHCRKWTASNGKR